MSKAPPRSPALRNLTGNTESFFGLSLASPVKMSSKACSGFRIPRAILVLLWAYGIGFRESFLPLLYVVGLPKHRYWIKIFTGYFGAAVGIYGV